MDLLLNTAVVVGALLVSALAGWAVVALLLRVIEPDPALPGLLRGGTWIGILERVAITGAILGGVPEAVAVIIAIKGLGRYPELRATDADQRGPAAERFIIGTLASYVWAALIAVLAGMMLR
ncbi:hypothetical protein [Bogoriella caseilytica]|uniref:Uncharacterized protein n=1 Tax=Bogoriella caseilytica TaxID=56055 RepID=A0A3N2BG70_9MICO|nr:hypothetical protein [Bogoriella caseilytica]ROR74252.1 hypothetical protein EDD31_2656 [Bogoriella caseilytica]